MPCTRELGRVRVDEIDLVLVVGAGHGVCTINVDAKVVEGLDDGQ